MGDIEKSLMQQVITNEKRAEEALVSIVYACTNNNYCFLLVSVT